ncbi:YceD family protein [Arsenicicoccus dermatophilus]|uniref:YceD family protein n=1 Tax=Arsenicicoccus dermatophilus TaxID=1076331 RepID=UPI0039171BE1
MSPLDPRSPLVFHTRELGRRPGSMHTERREVPAPEDLGTDVIAVPTGSPVDLDLRYESVLEGVLVSGTVTATATGACVRCLDEVRLPVETTFQELFAYADRARHHEEVAGEDDDDLRELEGDLLDLEPVLRDAVVPTLPFQPVCRADCPGLCSQCGERLADDPDHQHDVIDPRWSALQGLTINEEKRN